MVDSTRSVVITVDVPLTARRHGGEQTLKNHMCFSLTGLFLLYISVNRQVSRPVCIRTGRVRGPDVASYTVTDQISNQ